MYLNPTGKVVHCYEKVGLLDSNSIKTKVAESVKTARDLGLWCNSKIPFYKVTRQTFLQEMPCN